MSGQYILEGRTPVKVDDALVWARWWESTLHTHARRVGLTEVGDANVSTVFLGIDQSFGFGPPLLFETMIFHVGHPDLDGYQRRYTTWEEAEVGHAAAVALVEQRL